MRTRLDTSENRRSRRAGTSSECSTCTHRKSSASGICTWSSEPAPTPVTEWRKRPKATMTPIARAALSQKPSRWRVTWENTNAAGITTATASRRRTPPTPWPATARPATTTAIITVTRSAIDSSAGRRAFTRLSAASSISARRRRRARRQCPGRPRHRQAAPRPPAPGVDSPQRANPLDRPWGRSPPRCTS